jgi:hypothetical protein
VNISEHDLGETRRLLSIVLEQNQATGSIKLTEPELLQDILELLGLQQATRRETPMPAGTVSGTASTLDVDAMSPYMTVLGELNYMTQTRPDIIAKSTTAADSSLRQLQLTKQSAVRSSSGIS